MVIIMTLLIGEYEKGVSRGGSNRDDIYTWALLIKVNIVSFGPNK